MCRKSELLFLCNSKPVSDHPRLQLVHLNAVLLGGLSIWPWTQKTMTTTVDGGSSVPFSSKRNSQLILYLSIRMFLVMVCPC